MEVIEVSPYFLLSSSNSNLYSKFTQSFAQRKVVVATTEAGRALPFPFLLLVEDDPIVVANRFKPIQQNSSTPRVRQGTFQVLSFFSSTQKPHQGEHEMLISHQPL